MPLARGPETGEAGRTVPGPPDSPLDAPTPSEGTPVAVMLDHLMGLALAFGTGAEKTPRSGGAQASAGALDPAWRTALPDRLDALAAAWREPTAWEGMASVGGAELPAPAMGGVALNEVLIHGWDLAVATDQEDRPDPAAVSACLELVTATNEPRNEKPRNGQFAPGPPGPAAVWACLELVTARNEPGNEELRNGQFGPVVPVPSDAPALHGLLGLTGRSPAWSAR